MTYAYLQYNGLFCPLRSEIRLSMRDGAECQHYFHEWYGDLRLVGEVILHFASLCFSLPQLCNNSLWTMLFGMRAVQCHI